MRVRQKYQECVKLKYVGAMSEKFDGIFSNNYEIHEENNRQSIGRDRDTL